MENKMAEVAKLLGLKLGEEFTIKGVNSSYRFKLTAAGLMSSWRKSSKWNNSGLLEAFLTGYYQISKEANLLLNESEERYLYNVIKPFINKVKFIVKNKKFSGNYEYISISYVDSTGDYAIILPDFKEGTMYRGMKIGKKYALKELGL